jgi:DNA-binding LacI/PurR family transcriptional regulator
MGMNAVDRLARKINGFGDKQTVRIAVNTSLVERSSVAPCPARQD